MGGLNNDWLSQLAPAHAPPPPGWWPPAPGWWAVVVLFLLATAVVVMLLRRKPPARPHRHALRELQRLEAARIDDAQLAHELEQLMRRYAVAVYGREAVARLNGEDWLAFVVEHGGPELAGETGRGLLRAAYGGAFEADRSRWLAGARGFLRRRQ